MIINARDGNTAFGRRPYTNGGALAAFLATLDVNQSGTIEKFIRMDGEDENFHRIQVTIGILGKSSQMKFTTKTVTENGVEGIRVWRVK